MARRYDERYGRGGQRRDRDRADDRGSMERAGDEVRSWFGDEDAERRRHMDEQRDRLYENRYGSESNRDWNRAPRSDWDRSSWNRSEAHRPEWNRPDYSRSANWNRPDWNRPDRSRSDWESTSSQSRDEWNRPEDWRSTSEAPSRASGRPWSSSDSDRNRSTSRFDDLNRNREAYGSPSYRSGVDWSGDEGRSEFRDNRWGRGPKGYQRSDARILEDVCDRLTYSDVDASDIEVRVESGEVTLSGYVRDRSDKRRAEDVAEDVSGVRDVHNNIRVNRGDRGIGQSEKSASEQPGTVLGVNPTSSSSITNNTPPKRG